MAANMESGDSLPNDLAAEIIQSLARHINCLGESNRTTKKRAIENIRKETLSKKPPVEPEVLQKVFDHLQKPLLKCFADPVEKCRELTVLLISDFIDVAPNPEESLPYLIPSIEQRLGNQELIESSEEIRFSQIELLVKVVQKTEKKIAPFLDDLIKILQRTIVDPFADVRKESCKCTCLIARSIPQHFHLQSETLIKPLLQTISHQHSKVRVQCIYTIGDVLQYGNHKPMEQVISHLAQRFFDHSPQVRLAVTEVIGNWLLDFVDRYSYHHKLIPLLLTSQMDELPDIRQKALRFWDEVGTKYESENEKDLKDQMDFMKPDVAIPPGQTTRPNLGCRTLIFRHLSKILPGLINDLSDWTVANRTMASKLLYALLLNAEDHTTQHMEKLLCGMYKACGDEEQEVVQQVLKSAELVGFFVSPEVYCRLVLPALQSASNPSVLMTFAAILRGTPQQTLKSHLQEICNTLVHPDVCCSEQESYQYQLLACAEAIIHTSQQAVSDVSLQLFTVLLTILALARETDLKTKVKEAISSLASAQNLADSSILYQTHTKQVLDNLRGTYEKWTSYSVERLVFDVLLSEAGPVVGEYLDDIIPMLRTNLHPDKDPELRLKFFSLLSRLVMSAGETIDSTNRFGDFTLIVVKDMVMPNVVWHAGKTAAAIRTIAASCLWALLQSGMLNAERASTMMDDLLPQLNTLLEDDVVSTRLITCRILQKILAICGSTFHPDRLHAMYMELLKRLDDSNDEIRVAVSKTFMTFFTCFPQNYDVTFYRAHLETLYRGLLVHLDDPDQKIQQVVLDVLKLAAGIHPPLMLEEVEAVRHKHRSFLYCDELIGHIKSLAS